MGPSSTNGASSPWALSAQTNVVVASGQSARAWATSLRACSLAHIKSFFSCQTEKLSQAKVLPMVVGPTNMPCSDLAHWHNWRNVCAGAIAT